MKRALVTLTLLISSCASKPDASPVEPRVSLATNAGTITVRLLPEVAPQTVRQFLRLVRGGVYDTVYFYRVEQGFVAQVATADDRQVALSSEQRALIHAIPLEASRLRHLRGVVSLAHGDDPNSGETSFSILLGDAPHLDGKYTIFGIVEHSDDVLRMIEQGYDAHARNRAGVRLQILTMSVEE